ncbi:hypothetical protein CMI47_04895 [Candidatus Pacearchaeota archaeon]|nr:hypothetical protein [Candidatus Pacearchaeota archaeon]|tara:strand:+ start:2461 stop:3375 length:915 start_codon:yes stop_codon:yes gene_type:complete
MSGVKIAFVADVYGRVQYDRYLLFKKILADYRIDFFSIKNKRQIKKLRNNSKKYNIIYLASATNYERLRISHPKIISSITSWKILSMDKRKMKKIIKKPYAISVNNLGLYKELKHIRSDIVYLPNCVDTKVFCPDKKKKSHNPIVLGWTGNVDREEKNYKRLLKPVMKKLKGDVSFNLIKTKKGNKGSHYKSKSDMNLYYNSLDYYLNVSSSEGTPNPCLEAASCGIPLISTSVGNMPELIKHRVNGFFVKNKINSVIDGIRMAVEVSEAKYEEMSQLIRNDIEKGWSIKSREKAILDFFNKVL